GLPASRKVRGLIGYLSLAPHAVLRSPLCELLWDVADDPRGELRWCLSKLRHVTDAPDRRRVDTSGEAVVLDLADCFVDAVEIAAATRQGIERLSPERLRALCALFKGEFLDGLEIDRNPGFNCWLPMQRRGFRACQVAFLEHLTRHATGNEVFGYLEARLALAPFDRNVHELFLHALAQRDRIREGEQHLAATARLFEAEGLDCTPIADMWRAARKGGDSASRAPAASPSPADDPTSVGTDSAATAPRRASVAVMPFVDSTAAKPSIAVLPFENMSGDPEQEYFADGMVAEITAALSRFKWLFVIARNSSFTFKGTAVDIKEVGRRLGVRYVLEGSVRKASGKVRITGQLIDAVTGVHIWADRFERDLTDVFALQDDVTIAVVSAIQPKLLQTETAIAVRRRPEDLTAYDCYLRAMQQYYPATREGNAEAIRLARRALELDPQFGSVAALAGVCHVQNVLWGYAIDPQLDRKEAIRLSRLALSIDDDDP